jgi:hypothetical protein
MPKKLIGTAPEQVPLNQFLGSLAFQDSNAVQAPLISGTNIKTVGGQSVLGSGNLDVSGGIAYTLKTANYTAVDKEGILTDTSAGSFTITLPATPVVGAQVVITDTANSWGINPLTVARNGSTIGDLAENLICDISGISIQLVFDGSTWVVYSQAGAIGGNAVTPATLSSTVTDLNVSISAKENTLASATVASNTTAVADTVYVLTTSLTLTLPASPAVNTKVGFSNLSGTVSCIIARNGKKIMDLNEDMIVDIVGGSGILLFTGDTNGWILT